MTRQNRVNSRRSSGPVTPFQTQPSSDFVFSGLPLEHASKTQGCHGTGRPSGPKRPNGLKGKDRPKQDRPNQEPNQDQEPTEPRPTERRPTEPNQNASPCTSGAASLDRHRHLRLRLDTPFASGSVAPVRTFASGSVLPSPPARSHSAPSPPARCSLRLRLGRAVRPFASGSVAPVGAFACSTGSAPPASGAHDVDVGRASGGGPGKP